MKKDEVPQDDSEMLKGETVELQYAVNEDGEYEAVKSKGWKTKDEVMNVAWEEEKEKIADALALVRQGKKSPLYYFMFKCLMDVKILAMYTGFSRFKVKRHFNPKRFAKLNDEQLDKYVYAFGMKHRDELTNFPTDED